jgi:protein-L-isoaspartate(D-aspartate) O-methyltransferase
MRDEMSRLRQRMVREQIAARGIGDRRVLEAMERVPRHRFVDAGFRDRAYDDYPLPIGEGQTISQPYMVALMTQALELAGIERVLEIGTGSGYQTAILAELAAKVFTVERVPSLSRRALELLRQLGYHQVLGKVDDGTLGWPEHAPFDAVLVTAASPALPEPLLGQLKVGGVMVIPVGDQFSQVLWRVTRTAEGSRRENLGGCVFVKLVGKCGWRE